MAAATSTHISVEPQLSEHIFIPRLFAKGAASRLGFTDSEEGLEKEDTHHNSYRLYIVHQCHEG